MSKKTFLHIIILLISKSILSQDSIDYKFYNEESGIFNREIYNITSDEKGVIYFNSTTGVEYFNGITFNKFSDIKKNIFNKFPRLSFTKNKLAFNTFDEVYFFDGKKYSLFFKNNFKGPIQNLRFTKNGDFAIYNNSKNVYIRSTLFPSFFVKICNITGEKNYLKSYSFKKNGDILISTSESLLRYRNQKLTIIDSTISFASFIDETKKIILNVTSNKINVFDFNYNLLQTIPYRNDLFGEMGLDKSIINIYPYYVNEHLYIYSPIISHGFIDKKNSKSIDFIESSKHIFDISNFNTNQTTVKKIILPSNISNPTYFYACNNNELWLSCLNGLYKIKNQNIIPDYKLIKTEFPINNIIKDGQTTLFSDNFLNLFQLDKSNELTKSIYSKTIASKLKFDFSESEYCLIMNKNKKIYLGSIEDGIVEVDTNNNIKKITETLKGLDKTIMSLAKDNQGNVYGGGFHKIIKLDTSGKIKFLKHDLLKNKFIYNLTNLNDSIFIISDNNILLLYNDSIYNYFNDLKIYNTNFSNINKFNNKYILTTFNNGIFIVSKTKSNEWQIDNHLTKNNGLSSNEYFNVKIDNQQKIWALSATSLDIIQFYNSEYKITSLKNTSNLKNEYHLEGSFLIDDNNNIFYGGKHGISTFNANNIYLDSINNSQAIITNIYINDKKFNDTNLNYTLNEVVKNPILNYSQNDIKFEFGAIDFSDNLIQYKYSLKGFHDESDHFTKEKFISYRNLNSGNYTFYLQYSVNGNWSKPTLYNFTILAPWWKTKIAYGIYFLSSIVFLYFIFKLNSKRIERKYQQKLKGIKEENELLHLQSASLLNQFKPHFVFNALAPLQKYIYTSDKEKGIEYLHSFSNLMRSMLIHSREDFVTISSEIAFLNHYLTLQQIEKNERFKFKISNSILESFKIPSLMIQPIIENTIQHGMSETETGFIEILFEKFDENYIKIDITENGKGYDLKSQISNSRNRALNIIYDKIALFQKVKKSEKSSINTSIKNNLFTITVILPIRNED